MDLAKIKNNKEFKTSPDPERSTSGFNRLKEYNEDALGRVMTDERNIELLITLTASSPYLTNYMGRYDGFMEKFFNHNLIDTSKDSQVFYEELKTLSENINNEQEMEKTLRVYRNKEYVRIGLRDLRGIAHVRETTRELSDLASATLQCAYDFSYKELTKRFGEPYFEDFEGNRKKSEYIIIGMGKLGGGELNFSSDIDLIYFYSSDNGETEGIKNDDGTVNEKTRLDLRTFYTKLSEKVSSLINKVTDEGFVFRVDLDLRPDGKSGPITVSIDSAEHYYEAYGRSWERGAMIKARTVAGSGNYGKQDNEGLGKEFLEMIRPFVYRKYLDFGSIEEIKLMKEKIDIQLVKTRPDEINVKLGEGGIREIEFFCQALQLIHGGKKPHLRERSTMTSIDKLLQEGLINGDEAVELQTSYIFLRNLEHRIQIIDGRQTQVIPAKSEELKAIAVMMNIGGNNDELPKKLMEKYHEVTAKVYGIYKTLFYSSEKLSVSVNKGVSLLLSDTLKDDESIQEASRLGFKEPQEAVETIRRFSTDKEFRFLRQKSRLLFDKLKPFLLSEVAESPDPDFALKHTYKFLSALSARATHYSMLIENPALVKLLIRVFASSSFLANTLIETPGGLDLLLSSDVTRIRKTGEEIAEDLKEASTTDDYEMALYIIRRQKNLETFRIGINNISGDLPDSEVSDQLTLVAEAIMEEAVKVAEKELSKKYGYPKNSAILTVIGMGKLGGREIIYGSDLDIIFVYGGGDDNARETTGPKVISNQEYFMKLAQRVISVLSLKTVDGMAFEIDTELRPSGNSGALVIAHSSLLEYYKEKAAHWEKQAFVKARIVSGNSVKAQTLIKDIKNLIYSTPPTREDIEEQLRIRERMETELAKESETVINIKTGSGGLVDIEFTAQTLQLLHGKENPALMVESTMEAIEKLREEKLLTDEEWTVFSSGYNFFREIELKLRIISDKATSSLDVTSQEFTSLSKKIENIKDNNELFEKIKDLKEKVRIIYLDKINAK